MQSNNQQMIGQTLGPYRLERVIGRGGMGLVYLARQTRPARYVAIKVLQYRPEMGERSVVLARFQREANTAAMLEHLHIIPIFDYGELAQVAYLVMPYVSGGSLSDVLQRQGKLPLAQALDYLQQAASALDYAHAHGVIHRDLKPSNFLLYPDGRLVLADFGIARVLEGNEFSNYVTLSTPNAAIGTPSYMAPEMARGGPIDTRADVYSLGIVFFQMLSGRTPFQGFDALAQLYKQVNDPLPSLHTLDPTLPICIDAMLQKATAKRPEARYASAGDMLKDLQYMLQQSHIAFMPQTPYASDVAATYVHTPPQLQETVSTYSQQLQQSEVASAEATVEKRRHRPALTLLKALPLFALIIALVFVGLHISGVFALPFLPATPGDPIVPTNTPIATPNLSAVDAAQKVVIDYYDYINHAKYQDAYNLLSPNFQDYLSYAVFEKGYSVTIHDDVNITGTSQNSDGSVYVETILNTHESVDGSAVYKTFRWNATLIQVNGAWRIEKADQREMP